MLSYWLFFCNDRVLFSSNDQALLATHVPRHIQSVFNLTVGILMDIHVIVN